MTYLLLTRLKNITCCRVCGSASPPWTILRFGTRTCQFIFYFQLLLNQDKTPVNTVHHYKCHREEDPAVMIRPGHNLVMSWIMQCDVTSPEHRLRGVVVNVRGPDPAQQVQPTQSIEALPPPPAQMGRYLQRLYPRNENSMASFYYFVCC